jgi:hypothetical protein
MLFSMIFNDCAFPPSANNKVSLLFRSSDTRHKSAESSSHNALDPLATHRGPDVDKMPVKSPLVVHKRATADLGTAKSCRNM